MSVISIQKQCSRCRSSKPLNDFHKRSDRPGQGPTSFQAQCKQCNHANKLAQIRANKLKAIQYLGGQCDRCKGVFDPAVYDFHHRNPATKDKEIKRLLNRSWANIKIELDKCTLLCANCHRIIHNSVR